jgi:hypothetical protein
LKEPDIAALFDRALQGHLKIHDLDLVLDEWPPCLAVLAAPLSRAATKAIALAQ